MEIEGVRTEQLFPAKLLLMFRKKDDNTSMENNLRGLFVEVEGILDTEDISKHDKRTRISFHSEIFNHYTLQHRKKGNSWVPILSEMEMTVVHDRTYCVETKPSISLEVTDPSYFQIINATSVQNNWTESFIQSQSIRPN